MNVDKIIRGLTKMRAQLVSLSEARLNEANQVSREIESLDQRRGALIGESVRADTIAGNLGTLLGG